MAALAAALSLDRGEVPAAVLELLPDDPAQPLGDRSLRFGGAAALYGPLLAGTAAAAPEGVLEGHPGRVVTARLADGVVRVAEHAFQRAAGAAAEAGRQRQVHRR